MPISPIWPAATAVNAEGSIEFHGRTAESLLDEFGSPLYLIDTDEVVARARHFVRAAAEAFNTSTTHVSFAGKAFLSKEVVRLVTEAGMFVDTCTMGEMKIALAAGVPGRRLVLHGSNKSDEEIALAIEQGFAKIVIDEPDEPERVAAIARKLGKRARVMLRVTVGVHAGGHEYISTAHEDQKFGVPLLAAGADAAVLDVLNDLKDVTPAATNARISATHSPENGAEKTEKSERELHYDVKYPYDLSHEEIPEKDKALAAAQGGVVAFVGIVMLFWAVVRVFGSVEEAFNNIWEVKVSRSFTRQFTDYIAVVVITPILWVVGSTAGRYAGHLLGIDSFGALYTLLSGAVSLLVIWAMFSFIYVVVPNTRVRLGSAVMAGIVAGTLFLAFQWGYVWLQRYMTSYNAI